VPRRQRTHAAAVLALLGLVVTAGASACQPSPEVRAREVQARLQAFLEALRTGSDGFGWNLLRDDVRAAYPGGAAAWVESIRTTDTRNLTWSILDVTGDDFVGCANVDFGRDRSSVPFTLYDDGLPAEARVAATLEHGPFYMCATIGPLPWDTGIHGVG
jgi:hypothetical protein